MESNENYVSRAVTRSNEDYMKLGADQARYTMSHGMGGPFGAVIVKDGVIIARTSNSVLKDNDPTAHAEMNAIRLACKELGTYDLSGCELYCTGFPCPMCMSAIMWANIKKIYVSGLPEDADKIGFRDEFMYRFMKQNCDNSDILEIELVDRNIALDLYKEYQDNNLKMY